MSATVTHRGIPLKAFLVPLATAVALALGVVLPRLVFGASLSAWFEPRMPFTYVSPLTLLTCAVASGLILTQRRRETRSLEPIYLSSSLLWLLLTLGFPVLAVDELLDLHQLAAQWLIRAYQASGATPSHHLRELLPGIYALVGIMLLVFYAGELRQVRRGWGLLLAGAILMLAAVVLNLADTGPGNSLCNWCLLSDLAKIEGEVCFATGLFVGVERKQTPSPKQARAT